MEFGSAPIPDDPFNRKLHRDSDAALFSHHVGHAIMRMLRCPHCQERGLPPFSLWLSGEATPTRCKACGNSAYRNAIFQNVMAFLSFPLVVAASGLAIYLWSWWPLVLLLVLSLSIEIVGLMLPATPTTLEQAGRVRKNALILLLVFFIAVILAGVMGR